jgi:hypothetical protein
VDLAPIVLWKPAAKSGYLVLARIPSSDRHTVPGVIFSRSTSRQSLRAQSQSPRHPPSRCDATRRCADKIKGIGTACRLHLSACSSTGVLDLNSYAPTELRVRRFETLTLVASGVYSPDVDVIIIVDARGFAIVTQTGHKILSKRDTG